MARRGWLPAVLAGLCAGFAAGVFGVGGGLVLVPIMTALFGFTRHQAHGTSLAVIGATALSAVVIYGAFANVAWATAGMVALASVTTARFGARWAARSSSFGLARVFAVFLVLVALRLLWKAPETFDTLPHRGLPGITFDLILGSAIGVLAGYLGVGGGILAVPAFTLLFGMTQQQAQGTSLAVILVTAPAGALEHARHGHVVKRVVPMMALGAVLGSPLASWLVQGLPHEYLARAFALFLLVAAAHTWVQAGPRSRRREEPSAPEAVAKG